MTPKVVHNAVAGLVEMYRELLDEQNLRIIALTSENAMLRKTNDALEEKHNALMNEFAAYVKANKKDEQVT